MDQHPGNVVLPPPSSVPEFVQDLVHQGPAAYTGERKAHWSQVGYRLARELRSANWTRDQVEVLLSRCAWIEKFDRESYAFVVAAKVFAEPHPDWNFLDPEKPTRRRTSAAVW